MVVFLVDRTIFENWFKRHQITKKRRKVGKKVVPVLNFFFDAFQRFSLQKFACFVYLSNNASTAPNFLMQVFQVKQTCFISKNTRPFCSSIVSNNEMQMSFCLSNFYLYPFLAYMNAFVTIMVHYISNYYYAQSIITITFEKLF